MAATDSYDHPDAKEEMIVGGYARDVIEAHSEAWRKLNNVLSFDPEKAWALGEIQHAWTPPLSAEEPGGPREEGVIFTATFTRDDTPTPRSKAEAEYIAGEHQGQEA